MTVQHIVPTAEPQRLPGLAQGDVITLVNSTGRQIWVQGSDEVPDAVPALSGPVESGPWMMRPQAAMAVGVQGENERIWVWYRVADPSVPGPDARVLWGPFDQYRVPAGG